ncbi:MAG: hypothetical protein SFX73_39240 [Kofleriaceae bacterium]|nr:hypothetical protein [Kofleriaceae bacterium]
MAKKPQHKEPVIGRPLRAEEESTESITFRLTKSELAAYEAAAAKFTVTTKRGKSRPMKVSEWIRKVCAKALKR